MAFPVIPPEVWERIKAKGEKMSPKSVLTPAFTGVKTVFTKSGGILDALTLLLIAIIYFFFTGLALVLGRKLPKEWLSIGIKLNRGRIAEKIHNPHAKKTQTVSKTPTKYKVVDLETQKPIKI